MTTSKTDPTPTPIRVAAEAATQGSVADASAVPSVSQQSADLRTAVSKGSAEQASSPEDAPPLTLEFLSPAEQPDELGRLAEYRVLQELGHGGMGAVFLAEDPKLKRKVALKVMLPQVARVAVNRERFLREAQAAAQLEHDNVVSVYQVSEANGVPFIAMPFLKGESLQARLQREVTLPVSEVIRIGQQIAEGLAAAHEQDLVHRDIKPGNIWLESRRAEGRQPPDDPQQTPNVRGLTPIGSPETNTRVKILDFGLARLATSTEAQHLTTSGTILGTPSYMAPEQARGSHDVDFRCDLFSLGAVLYRMATGRQPFSGETIFALLTSLGIDTPAAPCDLNPNIPRELSDLILQLLAKPPEARPAHAREVAARLAAIDRRMAALGRPAFPTSEDKTAEGGHPTHDISTVILPATEQRRRRKTLRIGMTLVACVVLAGIILQFAQHGPNARRMAAPGRPAVPDNTASTAQNTTENNNEDRTGKSAHPTGDAREPRAPHAADQDREVAEWVLSVGGSVKVVQDGVTISLAPGAKLPDTPFVIDFVDVIELRSKAKDNGIVIDDELARFTGLKGLRTLMINNNPVTDRGVAQLRDLPKLMVLQLESTQVTDACLDSILTLPNLTNLYLRVTKVTPASLSKLKSRQKLHALSIDWPFTAMTASSLLQLPSLRNLELHESWLSDAGITVLRQMQPVSLFIQIEGRLSDERLQLLSALPQLERFGVQVKPLWQSVPNITPSGFRTLANLPRLTSFVATNFPFTDEHVAAIAEIKGLETFQVFHYGSTSSPLTDTGLEHLSRLPKLKQLTLMKTQVTPAGLARFRATKPDCQITTDVK